MKKRSLKKLKVSKKTIATIQETLINGGARPSKPIPPASTLQVLTLCKKTLCFACD
ncbi:hypothetical protein [uncultured Kordia sp.]|uniref:hypothetical protein n=1 Tax=uncultured Kordia sp. TaxID=507699 RepID=UPI00260CB9E6|nr:hypothetical protein [uncultured Kordia sp.]